MKKVKGYLIDAENRTVEEVHFEDELKEFYRLLDCTIVQKVTFESGGKNDVWLDEEGLFNNPEQVFFTLTKFVPWGLFVRRGLVLGFDDEGEGADTSLTLDEVKEAVEFFNGLTVRAKIAMIKSEGYDI